MKSHIKSKHTPRTTPTREVREVTISALKNGTVIDHIPPQVTFKIIQLLGLETLHNEVSAASNLPSKHMGKKGLVKIGEKFLSEEEVNKIAVVAPKATLNIIKNYAVVQKTKLEIPQHIERVIVCTNPSCITNHATVTTQFEVVTKDPLVVRCRYCERAVRKDEIRVM